MNCENIYEIDRSVKVEPQSWTTLVHKPIYEPYVHKQNPFGFNYKVEIKLNTYFKRMKC